MSEMIVPRPPIAPPLPAVDVSIRPGVLSDVPFLDALQKLHTKQVGWMPTKQFEGKIAAGHVLIAEMGGRVSSPAGADAVNAAAGDSRPPEPVGYCIGNDQYFKRDDVGIIYQMNVLPGKQRGLIGASLLQAQFERSAYGCRLYCCWCAQDIAANKFWEAMGFVALAYRAGSEKKGPNGQPRVHIFWQKRIRRGDTTTPWWFPAKTDGGAIREDRIVLPIPPGTHWSEAQPLILPNAAGPALIEDKKTRAQRKRAVAQPARNPIRRNGMWFSVPRPDDPKPVVAEPPQPKKPRAKTDPKLIAMARELRDRWLEQVNADPTLLTAGGKYEVSKQLAVRPHPSPLPEGEGAKALLPAA